MLIIKKLHSLKEVERTLENNYVEVTNNSRDYKYPSPNVPLTVFRFQGKGPISEVDLYSEDRDITFPPFKDTQSFFSFFKSQGYAFFTKQNK